MGSERQILIEKVGDASPCVCSQVLTGEPFRLIWAMSQCLSLNQYIGLGVAWLQGIVAVRLSRRLLRSLCYDDEAAILRVVRARRKRQQLVAIGSVGICGNE